MQWAFNLSNSAAKNLAVFFPMALATFLTGKTQSLWEAVPVPGRVPVWQIVRCADVYALKAETGLFRSTDGGQTWKFCGETEPSDGQLAAIGDSVLYHVHPGQGLFASVDAGASWQKVSTHAPGAGSGLAADATYVYYSTANGIYRYSKSGGEPASILQFQPYQQFATVKVANNILWANSNSALFKSENAGTSWSTVAEIPHLRCFHPHCDTLIVATKDELLRSDDGGSNWNVLDYPGGFQQLDWQDGFWLALCSETPVLWSGDSGQSWSPPATGPFPNYGATDVTKNGTLWLVSSHLGGVFRSPNHGEFWVMSNAGLKSPVAYPPEWLDQAGDFLLFNVGFTHLSVDGGDTWFMPLPTSYYDPFNCVVRHKNEHFALSLWGHIFQQSQGNPYGWVQRSSGYLSNSAFGYGGQNTRLHDLGDRMAVTGKISEPDVVFQSTNDGQSWVAVGTLPTGAFSVEAFGNQLYCLTSEQNCLASSNVGAAWIAANEGLPLDWGECVELRARKEKLFFLDKTRVFARRDGERPFVQILLPQAAARIWDLDTENGQLIIATDVGVFSTEDWGATWADLSANLEHSDFSDADLRLFRGSVYLLLPASSPSLWKYALPAAQTAEITAANLLSVSPNPMADGGVLRLRTREVFFEKKKAIFVQIFDSQGKMVLSRKVEHLQPGDEIMLNDLTLHPGLHFIRAFQGSTAAGCVLVKK